MDSLPPAPAPRSPSDLTLPAAVPILHACAGLVATDRAAREEILHRAQVLWHDHGQPENRDLEFWLRAESDVLRAAKAP